MLNYFTSGSKKVELTKLKSISIALWHIAPSLYVKIRTFLFFIWCRIHRKQFNHTNSLFFARLQLERVKFMLGTHIKNPRKIHSCRWHPLWLSFSVIMHACYRETKLIRPKLIFSLIKFARLDTRNLSIWLEHTIGRQKLSSN